jgi:P-type Cu2+ transporter
VIAIKQKVGASTLRVDAATPCSHCGLPLGRAWRAEWGTFCCAGCKTVHDLIHSEGLDRYYDLRRDTESPPPELRPDSFMWLDPLLAQAARTEDGVTRTTLDVQGVHCAACVWLLQQLWNRQRGAVDMRINPALGRIEFLWRGDELDLRDYLRTVERFGYRFGPPRKGDLSVSRDLVVRLGVCLAAALNVMIFSLCFYAGLTSKEGALYVILGRWSFALSTVAVAFGGSLFFVSAWRGLRRRVVHLDLPIAVGIALGYCGSVWEWVARGPEAAYFDTITIFIALMLLGRWLQERVLQQNRHSLLKSDGVDDLYTRRRRGSELETVPAAAIAPGDELWILPGDLVPVDGTLLGEGATMSLDWITGESRPRLFAPGESIPAGAFQTGQTPVRVSAREAFAASRLHTLLGGARGEAARSQNEGREGRWWNRFASLYVIAVLVLAATAFGVWLPSGGERAVEVALSVLVVTCPCALGLATPLANELVHTALRRRGIFVREPGFLRRVLRVRHILFDKTGTLTRGSLHLSERSRADLARLDAESRAVLVNACAQSLHPVSRTISAHLNASGRVTLLEGFEVREFAGRGLEIRHGGRFWKLGSASFALGSRAGETQGTCFTLDGRLIVAIDVEEQLKPDAALEVELLREEGYSVHLLSGDRPDRALRVAEQLSIPAERVRGGLEPEAKAQYVRALDHGDTWMVGDGINDGPAFDAAFCAATPAIDRPNLPARADLFYLGDGISAVRVTTHWARRLARVLRTNLVVAVTYNAVAVALCFLGYVGPLAAAVAMPASSLCFLTLTSVRLKRRQSAWMS